MKTVAIIGVGLIGGSFGLALRKAGFTGDLLGVSSSDAVEAAIGMQAIDRGATLAEAAQQADLIYLAQPVDRILDTLRDLGALAGPDCLITDAGSTKRTIVDRAASAGLASRFLGGHPMAGKETTGVAAADAELFRNRPYVITPDRAGGSRVLDFYSWLDKIGADVIEMSPDKHDQTVALTSHLPQIISTALALTLARNGEKYNGRIFGPGLVDMTRLAMSAPHLWSGILANNAAPVAQAMGDFLSSLDDIRKAAASSNLENLFEMAGDWSRSLRGPASTPKESHSSVKAGLSGMSQKTYNQ